MGKSAFGSGSGGSSGLVQGHGFGFRNLCLGNPGLGFKASWISGKFSRYGGGQSFQGSVSPKRNLGLGVQIGGFISS